jgi:hypothetical protein
MRIRHTYLAISEAKPGMRLAQPVCKVINHRMFQIQAGAVLAEEQIHQLAMRDIHFLVVEEDDPREEAEIEADRTRITAEIQQIFSEADLSQPAVAGLYQATLEYRLMHA